MPGPKTNEREGTRAVLRHANVSAYKVRQVIDAVRGKPVHEAADLLRFVERDAALLIGKLLQSAVANASNNDGLDPEELYVSACYVDEGPTAKRWRPRARGRATRIRKRTCHITLIVSRLPEHRLARLQARRRAENLAMRARRVEATRRARSEGAEGASRRARRHPEAFTEPDDETAAEAGTLEAGTLEADGVGGQDIEPDDIDNGEVDPEPVEPEASTSEAANAEAGASSAAGAGAPGNDDEEKDS